MVLYAFKIIVSSSPPYFFMSWMESVGTSAKVQKIVRKRKFNMSAGFL